MKTSTLCVAAVLAALAAVPASAQIASATPYGKPGLYQTPLDPVLVLSVDVSRTIAPTQLVLTGGFQGDPGAFLIAAADANTPFGNAATIYVGMPLVAVPGVYDQNGQMMLPFDPLMPTLSGVTLYIQGVDAMFGGGGQLSNGLRLAFMN